MGAGGVGKSALTVQYVQGFFLSFYDPTIEDCYRCQRVIDNEVVLMQVLDTAGQDDFSTMRDNWMRCSDCFLLVFSMTERRTFEELDEFYQRLLRVKEANEGEVPVVIVANKVDIVDGREVTIEEAQEKARKMGAPLIETSAKDGIGVADAFEQAVRERCKHASPRDVHFAGERRAGARRMMKALGCSIL